LKNKTKPKRPFQDEQFNEKRELCHFIKKKAESIKNIVTILISEVTTKTSIFE